MTMVSTGVDALGDPAGPDDGLADPVGDGLSDGAGVTSGGPASTDGAAVGGTVGTAPRLPDVEHAAATMTMLDNARARSEL
jgi:hypothetical protein